MNLDFDDSCIDLAFINGRIVTVNQHDDIVEAVGVKDNKIVFVGTTADLMTLVDSNGISVKILGCLDGLECDYSSEYSVDFRDNDYNISVEYELENSFWYDSSFDVANDSMYIPEDDEYSTYEFPEQELGVSLDFEDTTIYYSIVHTIETYKDGGWTSEYKRYKFVRDVADGVYLVADVYVYPDSDKWNASAEELAQVISSQYFSVQ